MVTPSGSPAEKIISFINRDHMVSVTIHARHIVVMTTTGTRIRISASESAIGRFADDLANSVQSNFVSIAHPRLHDRFVDEGLEFVSIVQKKSN